MNEVIRPSLGNVLWCIDDILVYNYDEASHV